MKAAAQVPKLRFPGFEGEWLRQQLDAITSKKISYGIVQAGEHVPDGMPYIKSQDLNQPLALDSLQRTSEEIARKYRRSEVEPGDIVFSLRGNIGVCQIVPASIPEANLTQGTARIAVADYDNRLVAQTLQTLDVVRQIEACAKGSTFREISLEALRKITVALAPTFPEQQKIAAFLTAVDGRIEQLSRKKALLEAIKKGVMQQLFTQTLRFQDDHGHDFPDWEEKPIGESIDLSMGFPFESEDILEDSASAGRPRTLLMRGVNITEGEIRHTNDMDRFYCGDVAKLEKYVLAEGDMVIGMDGSKVGRNSAIVGKREAGALLVQRVARIRALDGASLLYIYHHINSPFFHRYVDQVKTSSGIPHISAKQIREFTIGFPSLPEQTKIAGILSALDGKIGAVGEQMRQTQAWKKGLLQQMFV